MDISIFHQVRSLRARNLVFIYMWENLFVYLKVENTNQKKVGSKYKCKCVCVFVSVKLEGVKNPFKYVCM